MSERRTYQREELSAAMICTLICNHISTHCLVRNVSLDGALVEWPLADELSDPVDVGDLVALGDILSGPKALFRGDVASVRWVYKRTLGLQFEILLRETPEELRAWLEEQGLV